MKSGWLKNTITYLFLVLVLSVKMAGLHALSHSDDQDHALHCTICDQAVAHNLDPALPPEVQEFILENPEVAFERAPQAQYNFEFSGTLPESQLFSRPPPSLL